MKTIPLSQGYLAVVDNRDFTRASKLTWHADIVKFNGKRIIYAKHTFTGGGGIRLHNFLLGMKRVDHKDGDGLNNRRSNLRKANHAQNMANRQKFAGSSSQFKGVWWESANRKWRAAIKNSRGRAHLGYFTDEKAAAEAYNRAAREQYGEFARLNKL